MNINSISLAKASVQYINIGDNSYFLCNIGANNLTIEAWVKPSSTDDMVIASADGDKQGGAANRAFIFSLNGKLNFQASNNGNDMNIGPAVSPSPVPANQWTHVAVTYNEANSQISLYINGVLDIQTAAGGAGPIQATNVSAKIGARGYSLIIDLFNGLIDDFRIWNTVRSASDILTNYKRELAGNEPNLLGYFKFNNNYIDSSGNVALGPSGTPSFSSDVPFADSTTTSTSTSSTSTSSSTTTTSTSTSTTTSTSTSTSTTTTSTSTTTTSTSTTQTTTSTTTTSTSTTTTSTSTTTTSTSTTTTTSTSTSTTITIALRFMVEKVR